jgi:hypothetical protein
MVWVSRDALIPLRHAATAAHEPSMNIDVLGWLRTSGADLLSRLDLPHLLGHTSPLHVSAPILALIVVSAVALSIPKATWAWFGLFTTLVHELGHAFGALLTGRIVHGIQVHQNHSGSTVSVGYGTLSLVISGFFGYPAPALAGAGLLWSVFTGYTAAAMLAGTVIILLTLLFIRNGFGLLVVLGSAAVSAALWYWGSPTVQGVALLIIGVSLLVGAVRGLATVVTVHTSHRERLDSSDAYILYSRTMIPSPIWLAGFAGVIGWCVWAAGLALAGTV